MATGDIGAVIDTLEFEAVNCQYPRIIRVNATICAMIYNGADNDGWIATATVNADGSIDDAVIDSMEFEADFCWNMCVCHVSGAVYAIAYRGPTNHGWIKTVQVNADGTIENAVIDSLEFDAVNCDYPDIIEVGDGYFAIAYSGATNNGWVTTVYISAAGMMGVAVTDTLEVVAVIVGKMNIRRIGVTANYVIVQDRADSLWAVTVEIDATGIIGAAAIDTLQVEAVACSFPCLQDITDNIFAITYQGPAADGWMKTITANNDGTFVAGFRDSFEFDLSDCQVPLMIPVGESVYALAYVGTTTNGTLKTFTINNDGSIDEPVIDTLVYAPGDSYTPDIVHMDGNIYVVVFRPWSLHGYIKSIDIETPVPSGSQHIMMMGIG